MMRYYVGTHRCLSGRVEYADRYAENDLLGRLAIAQALGKQWYDTRLHTTIVLCERCAGGEDLELREDRHYYCDDSPRLQGGGFWNDAGVSSHTVRSVHATSASNAQNNFLFRMAQPTFRTLVLLPRVSLPWNPASTIELEVGKRTTRTFFCEETKVAMFSLPFGGVPFIPHRVNVGAFRHAMGKHCYTLSA